MCLIFMHYSLGTLPKVADGIVQRSACVNFMSSCDSSLDICIRSCDINAEKYMVYYLTTPNNVMSRYCFGKI